MLQRLLKVNAVYAVGSVANGAALFLLIPFFVRYLGPADFGLWSISEIMIYFLNLVMMAGMDIYLMREYWFLKNESERKILVGTLLSMVLVWGLGVMVLFALAILPFIKKDFYFNQFDPVIIILIIITGFSEVIFTLLISVFRVLEKPFHYVFLSLGRMFVFMGLAIFWTKIGSGLSGALAGRLTAAIVFIIIAWVMAHKYIQLGFSSKYLRPWANYGLPMVLAGFLLYVLISADRYALQVMASLEVVAIYSFSYKLAASVDILVTRPFAMDWAARRFSIATQEHPERKYAEAAILYAFISLWCALMVQAAAPVIYKWFAPAVYVQGLKALPILMAANIAMGLSYPLNVGIMLKDRTKLLLPITALVGIVYILALYVLIPSNPIQGAAWATLLAYSLYTIGVAVLSLRLYPVNYPIRKWLMLGEGTILAATGLFLASLFCTKTPLLMAVLIRGLWVFLVFALTGYFLWKHHFGHAALNKAVSSE